ncbi:MAG: glycosyltransferase [Victivallales bacterium]|nr:glycosyltransferase [Victivallales bacterium]
MKRVLYIDSSCFFGGAQASLLSLRRTRTQCECQYCIAGCSGLEPDCLIGTHHYKPGLVGMASLLRDARAARPVFRRALDSFAPDVVFLNTLRSALLWRAAGVKTGAELVINDRDVRCPRILPRLLDFWLHPNVQAVSRSVAEKWAFLKNGRLSVAPNVFDIDAIASARPAELPFMSTEFKIVMAGDFTAWKNHGLLLEAMAVIREKCPEARCLLKGRVHTADDRRCLEQLKKKAADLHLEDLVFFNDADESALPYIAACDCLVSCSMHEPFGRTVVEALALGKVVATARYGADADLVADCPAISIADYNPASLADAILQWRSQKARRSARPAALARARKYEAKNAMR